MSEERFKGALSLAERPHFREQSPGLFPEFTPAERTCVYVQSRGECAGLKCFRSTRAL